MKESLVNYVVSSPSPNGRPSRIRFKGLDERSVYLVTNVQTKKKKEYSGSALMYGGYTFPLLTGDYPSLQLHLTMVEEEKEEA